MTEINNIPKHWQVKKLSEIGEIVSGGTPSTKVLDYWDGNISWISPADLSGYSNTTITKGRKSITKEGLKNSSARLIPKGSVLFSSRAPIGYVVIAGNEVCTNQGFKSIVPNKLITTDYLFFYLKASKQRAEKVASGTTFKEISLKAFSIIEIPLPPLPEQQAIVSKIEELFSELDNGIAQLKTAQQQLKVYRQSLLKWAFEGKLTNTNVKEGELPKGWKYFSLKELKQFSLYGPRFSSKDYSTNGVAVLRTTDISERGKVDWENSPKLNLTNSEYEKYKLLKNDLLITRTGSIGRMSIFNDNKRAIPGAFLIHYRLKPEFNIWYIFHFLKSQISQKHFKDFSFGVGRPNLNVPNIELLKIPIPSVKEQQLIVSELESKLTVCDKIEETISQSLQQAETLRQSILKKAFEGKLVTNKEFSNV